MSNSVLIFLVTKILCSIQNYSQTDYIHKAVEFPYQESELLEQPAKQDHASPVSLKFCLLHLTFMLSI